MSLPSLIMKGKLIFTCWSVSINGQTGGLPAGNIRSETILLSALSDDAVAKNIDLPKMEKKLKWIKTKSLCPKEEVLIIFKVIFSFPVLTIIFSCDIKVPLPLNKQLFAEKLQNKVGCWLHAWLPEIDPWSYLWYIDFHFIRSHKTCE